MASVIVALPNDSRLAAELGKKGSENGITFYNRKVEGSSVVVLTPTDLESKFYALGEIISISELVVTSTAKVDSLLGESVIASALLGKKVIFTDDNDVSKITSSVGRLDFSTSPRNMLLQRILEVPGTASGGDLRIDVDKSFPVKGVGTVLLGIVRSGKVRVHDTLKSSSGKDVIVRSIQVHDDDMQEAVAGERVGLAVKGIEDKEIEKGDALSKTQIPLLSSFRAEIRYSPLYKGGADESINCTVVSGFSVSNCKVSKSPQGFDIKLDKPAALMKGDSFLLIREKAPRVFASGVVL